jgi:hypothetical protein
MNRLVLAVLMTPLVTGAAFAGQPLADAQLDMVAAGFSARSVADAEGLAGSGGDFTPASGVQIATIQFPTGAVFPTVTVNSAATSWPFSAAGALAALSLR